MSKIPKSHYVNIVKHIDSLSEDPFQNGSRKIKGYENRYRIRIAEYRIIYEVFAEEVLVHVVKIGHRKEVLPVKNITQIFILGWSDCFRFRSLKLYQECFEMDSGLNNF